MPLPDNEENILRLKARSKNYSNLFDTPAGHEVLNDLMSRFGVFGSTFDPDSHAAAHNEGQRSVVIYILEQVKHAKMDPSFYLENSLDASAGVTHV